MLKITIVDRPMERRLVLEGRLIEPDVRELQLVWKKACLTDRSRTWIVDLRGVTFIDERADTVLLDMNREGAQFMACGVSNTYRLEQLGIKCKPTLACQSVGAAQTG